MLANATNIPELEISDDEAKEFAKAAQNVARHYSVQTTQKTLDWIALVGVTAALYGPRIAAVGFRRRSERKPVPSDGNVVHIRDPYNGIQPHDFNGNGAAE